MFGRHLRIPATSNLKDRFAADLRRRGDLRFQRFLQFRDVRRG